MDDEPDNTSSNPQADDHLPVSGEISDLNGMPSHDNPLLNEEDYDTEDFGEEIETEDQELTEEE